MYQHTGRDQMTTTDLHETYGLQGWELWQTGGGCEAFARTVDGTEQATDDGDIFSYVLATVADDAYEPQSGEEACIGLYGQDGQEIEIVFIPDGGDAGAATKAANDLIERNKDKLGFLS
jgi:hypothetical protein